MEMRQENIGMKGSRRGKGEEEPRIGFAFTCRHTHAASHSHILSYHNGILLLTDMLARAAFSYALWAYFNTHTHTHTITHFLHSQIHIIGWCPHRGTLHIHGGTCCSQTHAEIPNSPFSRSLPSRQTSVLKLNLWDLKIPAGHVSRRQDREDNK